MVILKSKTFTFVMIRNSNETIYKISPDNMQNTCLCLMCCKKLDMIF